MPSDFANPADFKMFPHSKPHNGTKPATQLRLTRIQLIESVACVLEGMIDERCSRYTDINEIPVKTMFHAQKLPSISLKDYLIRFATHSQCQEDAFVYALVYLDKIGDMLDDFNLDPFNVHRLVLIGLVAACKFNDDYYYKNSYYARIGGVNLQEFNKLEEEFIINYIQFSLYVKPEDYAEFYQDLVHYHQGTSENITN